VEGEAEPHRIGSGHGSKGEEEVEGVWVLV
jgi:hypothetical protein